MLNSFLHSLHDGDTIALLLLILTTLVVLLLVVGLILALYAYRLNRRLVALTRGADGQDLAEVFATHLEKVDQTVQRMEALEQAVAVLQAQMPGCLQHVTLHRYDAFEDVGGEQSFSVALLDGRGDGIVVTSVYSRMDVRVYAKSIQKGQASHTLSREEEHALRGAPAR